MIKNAISIDVEDYYQVSAFAKSIDYKDWDQKESRVEKNTYALLELFEETQVKCTFFVLGWVAERYPALIADIAKAGHEVASHGYSHQLIYKQTQEVFKQETIKSKAIIEDIVQYEIQGYRAASFSIIKESQWALDVLYEAGFRYDSSIFPVKHDRYGMPGVQGQPHKLNTPSGNKLVEFPMTAKKMLGYQLPVSGGGYFRLYPYWFTKYALKSYAKEKQMPFMFYLHPWEIDPSQPKIDASWFSRFRHYNNLRKCKQRLTNLLSDFEFTTVADVLQKQGLLT